MTLLSLPPSHSQTYIGQIVVAMNPFKEMPRLYDRECMERYHANPKGLAPHIYNTAELALRTMKRLKKYAAVFYSILYFVDSIAFIVSCRSSRAGRRRSSSPARVAPARLRPPSTSSGSSPPRARAPIPV
jgi:hypothetical protein